MDKQKLFLNSIIGLSIYLIATGVSYGIFSYWKPNLESKPTTNVETQNSNQPVEEYPGLPKTEACPLNGMMYTKPEREIWETRRPLAVMIENHEEARPQSGLSKADIIYESVVEGGITRFMAVFYCGVAKNTLVAPVRSARTFFLPWVLEYNALYNHVGGAGRCSDDTVDDRAKALCQIGQYDINDMDQMGLPFKVQVSGGSKISVCYRNYDRLDHEVATEHTMVCETNGLYTVAKQDDGITNVDQKDVPWDKNFVAWKFKDDTKESDRGATFSASFTAWKGYENNYGVKWDYDKTTNKYTRSNGNIVQKDLETNKTLTAKSIVIMFVKEIGPVDDHLHLLYENIGNGVGMLLQDGKVEKISWKKKNKFDRTRFYDDLGKEVVFNRGQIWIEQLPIGTQVKY